MTTERCWPERLDDIWAKSPADVSGALGESLVLHTWNVLGKLSEMARLRPGLPTSLGFPRLWHCLFWACWLHDFGKATQGFQDSLRGGERWRHRHEIVSLSFLDWISSAFTDVEARWVAAAIASHHRDVNEIRSIYSSLWLSDENQLSAPVADIPDHTLNGLWRWISGCAPAWIERLGFGAAEVAVPVLPQQAEAVRIFRAEGAEQARFWLKAYVRYVDALRRHDDGPQTIGTIALRGHIINCDHSASAHAAEMSSSGPGTVDEMLGRLQMGKAGLFSHQSECAEVQGSTVLIAPTGSGKTEAALLWASGQSRGGRKTPRLFYTLPFQASMNAMYDRLNAKAFPGQVGLEHSRSILAMYRRLLDENYSAKEASRLARWSRNLAQLNHYPVRVLSPYQILKAPYRLKGYEALLSDFFDAGAVLDEIHAYEPDRLAMILATVRYLREHFGARFLVMSATLPGVLQARLAEALGSYTTVRATREVFARFSRHKLFLRDGDLVEGEGLAEAAACARSGQSVLVCCNLVGRAQRAYAELQGRLGGAVEVVLLHGRFNGVDRLIKENVVRAATGSKSAKRRPIVLVATQVVEVSLDIDLDVIYSDPAPLEALVQRFGRVNRRLLRKWAPVYVFREPAGGQRIYEGDLVAAGLGVLENSDGRMIDEEAISDWLDQVYTGKIAERWNRSYEQAYGQFYDGVLRSLRAFDSGDGLEREFYKVFDSIEVLPGSLEPRYRQLVEDDPLEASQLLVSIRWGQFAQLNEKGKVAPLEAGFARVVDVDYDCEYGLRL